jgi:flagella basal body P-ring formation protein FlgA
MILAILILAAAPEAACIAVAGERILVRDLVAAVPALAALPPEAALGYTPAPGARRLLGRQELAGLAERHGVRLEAAPSLCVERAARPLAPERLEKALRAALAQAGIPAARLEIVDFSRYPVPEGELEFARSGLPALPRAGTPVTWRGHVRYGSNRSLGVWARVKLSVAAEGLVAAGNITSGRPIEAAQVRLATLEWFPFAEAPVREPGQAVGRVARRVIRAGAPILMSALGAAREIERGETVSVEVSSGATQLRFQARAESGGSAGDSIMLRNPSSGRLFPARVEKEGKVVVNADSIPSRPGGRASVPAGGGGAGRPAR